MMDNVQLTMEKAGIAITSGHVTEQTVNFWNKQDKIKELTVRLASPDATDQDLTRLSTIKSVKEIQISEYAERFSPKSLAQLGPKLTSLSLSLSEMSHTKLINVLKTVRPKQLIIKGSEDLKTLTEGAYEAIAAQKGSLRNISFNRMNLNSTKLGTLGGEGSFDLDLNGTNIMREMAKALQKTTFRSYLVTWNGDDVGGPWYANCPGL